MVEKWSSRKRPSANAGPSDQGVDPATFFPILNFPCKLRLKIGPSVQLSTDRQEVPWKLYQSARKFLPVSFRFIRDYVGSPL